jgi:hypothetical protein
MLIKRRPPAKKDNDRNPVSSQKEGEDAGCVGGEVTHTPHAPPKVQQVIEMMRKPIFQSIFSRSTQGEKP